MYKGTGILYIVVIYGMLKQPFVDCHNKKPKKQQRLMPFSRNPGAMLHRETCPSTRPYPNGLQLLNNAHRVQ